MISLSSTSFANQSGQAVVPTIERSEQTLIPFRHTFERMGYAVNWDQTSQTAIAHGDVTVYVSLPSDPIRWIDADGMEHGPIRTQPFMQNDHLYIDVDIFKLIFPTEQETRPLERIRISVPDTDGHSGWSEGVVKSIEDEYGIQLQVDKSQGKEYRDRLNLMVAAGDLSDMAFVPATYTQLHLIAEHGLLKDLSWTLAVPPSSEPMYAIPHPSPKFGSSFPIIRKSWLDVLGLDQPQTPEQLRLVIEMFTDHDPNGTGRHDTIGLTGWVSAADMGSLQWVEQMFNEGEHAGTTISSGTRQALAWLRDLYQNGWLDPEFAVLTPEAAIQKVVQRKAGITGGTLETILPIWEQQEPFDLETLFVPLDVGVNSIHDSGWWVINKRVDDETASTLIQWIEEIYPENKTYEDAIGDSPTSLDKEIQEMKVKVIMGNTTLEEWDQFVAELEGREDV